MGAEASPFGEKHRECTQMTEDAKTSDKRKPYESPKLVMISLRPEEAVLGTCKSMTTGAGPVGSACLMTGACMSIGS